MAIPENLHHAIEIPVVKVGAPCFNSKPNSEMYSEPLQLNDPSSFANTRITQSMISSQLNNPCQPDATFAFEETQGRRFLTSWFSVELPNEIKQKRHWLTYSQSLDRAYCLDCILFAGASADEIWTQSGYQG